MDRTLILYPRYDLTASHPLMVDLASVDPSPVHVLETGDTYPIVLQFCQPNGTGDALEVVTLEAGDTIVLGAKRAPTDTTLLFSLTSWTATTLDAETAYSGTLNLTTVPSTFWQGQSSRTITGFIQVRDAANTLRFTRRFSLTLNRGLYTAEPTGAEDPPFLDTVTGDNRYLSYLSAQTLDDEEKAQATENLFGPDFHWSATTATLTVGDPLGETNGTDITPTGLVGRNSLGGQNWDIVNDSGIATFLALNASEISASNTLSVGTNATVGGTLSVTGVTTLTDLSGSTATFADEVRAGSFTLTGDAATINGAGEATFVSVYAASGIITGTLVLSTTPTNSDHAVNKAYVDNLINGLKWKASVVVATTANGTFNTAFANGQTVDGVTLVTGDRILLKDQSTASQNGIYTVNASGAPTRAADADTGSELVSAAVCVQTGTVNADRSFVCTNNAITIGSTSITWVSFASTIGALVSTNNLSDLANAATARTNLGLGNVENTALSTWTGSSTIVTVGTIATGTWQGSIIAGTYGGTGVNNGSYTLTLGGNVSFSSIGRTLANASDAKAAVTSLVTITDNANTSITLADSDSGGVLRCTAATAVTITVPSTLASGFNVLIIQAGAGQVTISAGSGTTINSYASLVKTAGQHAGASLIRVAAGTYNLSGNLA